LAVAKGVAEVPPQLPVFHVFLDQFAGGENTPEMREGRIVRERGVGGCIAGNLAY
jgi:hypothetical protein